MTHKGGLSTIIWLSVVLAGGRALVAEHWWLKQSVQAWISGDYRLSYTFTNMFQAFSLTSNTHHHASTISSYPCHGLPCSIKLLPWLYHIEPWAIPHSTTHSTANKQTNLLQWVDSWISEARWLAIGIQLNELKNQMQAGGVQWFSGAVTFTHQAKCWQTYLKKW